MFLGLTGCYLPSLSHTRGAGTVQALEPDRETDATLRQKLGRPDVLDLPTVRVWEWRQTYGYLLVGGAMQGYLLPMQGKAFRVLARFEGERVMAIETESEPKRVKGIGDPLPEALVSIPWEGPGSFAAGAFFAVGKDGGLWRKASPAEEAVQVVPGAKKGGRNAVIAVSPDGQRVVVAGPRIAYVWDDLSRSVLSESIPKKGPWPCPPYGSEARFSPDGRWLVLVGSRDSALLDTATWQPVWTDPKQGWSSAFFSPEGDRLVIIRYRELRVIETATGRVTARMALSSAPRWNGLLLPGGELLLACGSVLTRWDLAEMERLHREGQQDLRLLGGPGAEALREVRLLPMLAGGGGDALAPLLSQDGTLLLQHGPGRAWFGIIRAADLQAAGLFRKDERTLSLTPILLDSDGLLHGVQVRQLPRLGPYVSIHHLWKLPLRGPSDP